MSAPEASRRRTGVDGLKASWRRCSNVPIISAGLGRIHQLKQDRRNIGELAYSQVSQPNHEAPSGIGQCTDEPHLSN